MRIEDLKFKDLVFGLLSIGMVCIVFALDLNSRAQISFSGLYTLAILFSWLSSFFWTILASSMSSILILYTAYSHVVMKYPLEETFVNSFVGFTAVIVTFVLTKIASNSMIEMKQTNSLLNDMVMQRTQELTKKVNELTEHRKLLMESKDLLEIMQDEMQKSEQKYQIMIEKVSDYSLVFLTPEGKIQTWNKGAQKLTGYLSRETIGRYFYEFVMPNDVNHAEKGDDIINDALMLGTATHEGYRMLKDGSLMYAHDQISAIKQEDGDVLGFIWVTRNMTGQKLKEEEIDQLNKDLESKVVKRTKELESFAYSVSHDLRAPLRAISGFSQILKTEYAPKFDDADVVRYLDIILTNTKKMSALIDDLLSYSRLGKKSVEKGRVDMKVFFEQIIDEILSLNPNYKKAQFQLPKTIPIISADKTLLKQAMINLISNSLKYSEHREQPLVKIDFFENDKEVQFCIEDNGAGFDMKYADKLFKVFQRLHDGTEFEGTGIGLAIVKQVIENHNGRVWAEAEVNKGAKFFFTLPNSKNARLN